MHSSYIDIGSPHTKVVEECAELIQAISKAARFGIDNQHQNTGVTNRQRIIDEMLDVEYAIQELRKKFDTVEWN